MAQHFLLSRTAKTLSLAQVFRMTDAEAETAFKFIRWADTNGTPGTWLGWEVVLRLHVDGEPVWDTLAICETLAERFTDKHLWPTDARARQVARSVCAEMHSGFQGLRGAMPMNIRSRHPGKGMNPDSKRDIDRVVAIWSSCRERFGKDGALLFGRFSIADAYYAPVVTRFQTYAVELPRAAQAYCDAVLALGGVRAWMDAARRETEFVQDDEPYASGHR